MTGQAESKYFTEPPCYTQVQQIMKVLVVAAGAILTQTLTLMPTPDFLEEFPIILIPTQSSIFKSYP